MEELLSRSAFFNEFPEKYLRLIARCGRNRVYSAGEQIAREGDDADAFYLVRSGKVSIEVFVPNRGAVIVDVCHPGEVVGWSWLFPPYRWSFDVRAIQVSRLTALDGKCLREKAEEDTQLGYFLMKRFARVMTERLERTRLRILDVYGDLGRPGA
jgi:CRP-like cAMP-binding protein